jgi:Spy/CpxP family protein refolding chaperone
VATAPRQETNTMARHLSWALIALLLTPAAAPALELCDAHVDGQAPQQAGRGGRDGRGPDGERRQPPPKWWVDEPMRSELGISEQQSAAIEQVWQQTIPKLREARERLDKLEEQLSRMILDASDEAAVVAQIEKVENTRADANKARTLMLYRMNRVLTPEQRVKAKAMHDQREAARRGSDRMR